MKLDTHKQLETQVKRLLPRVDRDDRKKLEYVWEGYLTARALANGQDPNRAEYWTHKLYQRTRELKALVFYLIDLMDIRDSKPAC